MNYSDTEYKISTKHSPHITDEKIATVAVKYIQAFEARPSELEEEVIDLRAENLDLKAEIEALKIEKKDIMHILKTIVECSEKLKRMVEDFMLTQVSSDK
jgi:hypothetical protein